MQNSKIGEAAAKEYLAARGWNITDVSNNPDYWNKDIDLIASKGNDIRKIEVKWDEVIAKSGNMFIELLTDILDRRDGWIYFTEADFVFYGDAQRGFFYVFKPEEMRAYLKNHINTLGIKTAKDKRQDKLSIGALVNPKEYNKEYGMFETECVKQMISF